MDEPASPQPFRGALVPLVALCLAPFFAIQLKSYDLWWHLATGRWMVEHGTLPTTDPFTYTMAGQPWQLVNGISDLVLYGFYQLGGAPGLVLCKVIFAWLTLTLVGLGLRSLRISRSIVVALLVLAAVLVQARYSVARPMIFGASLIAAANWVVLRCQGRPDRSLLFFLVALPVWPLVHGTALVGLMQLGALYVAVWLGGVSRRRQRGVEVVLACCLVLSVALPWWRDLYRVAMGLDQGATAMQLTAEWRTGLESLGDRVGHWAVIVGGLIGGGLHARRQPLPLLLALSGALLAQRYGRNAYEGVLLALPGFGLGLQFVAAAMRARGKLLLAVATAPLLAAAIGLVQLTLSPRRTVNTPFGLGVVRERFPYDTLDTLEQLPAGRLIHGFAIGGFLIWNDGPWGVYCDGRTVALYRESDVERLFAPLLESAESLTAAADHWQAPYGLTQHGSHPNQWMMVSPEWVPIHLGLGTSLFVRRTSLGVLPPTVRPLHLLRYTTVTDWTVGWYRGILADPALRAQLRAQVVAAAQRGPHSPMLDRILRVVGQLAPQWGDELAAIVRQARQ
ncbi:MAG: hypothetical protein JRI68_07615 [Deltaproteobacteria bacterium]|nr:hypothetical protein [Deltaproteobacteria bacterium]